VCVKAAWDLPTVNSSWSPGLRGRGGSLRPTGTRLGASQMMRYVPPWPGRGVFRHRLGAMDTPTQEAVVPRRTQPSFACLRRAMGSARRVFGAFGGAGSGRAMWRGVRGASPWTSADERRPRTFDHWRRTAIACADGRWPGAFSATSPTLILQRRQSRRWRRGGRRRVPGAFRGWYVGLFVHAACAQAAGDLAIATCGRPLLLMTPGPSGGISAFWVDRTEVTNGQYARCVDAGAYAPR
jgi:hypothetical protein